MRNHPRLLLAGVLGLALAAGLPAQAGPHPTTVPAVSAGTFTGTASSFPLGRTGGRVQYWYRGDATPIPSVLTAVGPRPVRGVTHAGRTQSVEITMASTTLGHSTITRDFAQNLGPQAVVTFTRKNVPLPPLTNHQDPDAPSVWMLFDTPFVATGPHLLVQFDLGPATGATSAPPNGDMLLMSSGTARHFTSARSCGGQLAASSTATAYTLALTAAPPLQPAILMLSLNARTFSGLPLPTPLDAAGMTGCVLGVDPLLFVPGATDASGRFDLQAPLPPLAASAVVYGQGVHPTTANPAGLATTSVVRSILGNTGYCNYIYNFTADGALAQTGPFAYNICGNLLFRP